jgi:hypothetical protein
LTIQKKKKLHLFSWLSEWTRRVRFCSLFFVCTTIINVRRCMRMYVAIDLLRSTSPYACIDPSYVRVHMYVSMHCTNLINWWWPSCIRMRNEKVVLYEYDYRRERAHARALSKKSD